MTKPSEAAREYAKDQEPLEPPGSGWGFTDDQIETAFDAGVKAERERILKAFYEHRANCFNDKPYCIAVNTVATAVIAIIEGGE